MLSAWGRGLGGVSEVSGGDRVGRQWGRPALQVGTGVSLLPCLEGTPGAEGWSLGCDSPPGNCKICH